MSIVFFNYARNVIALPRRVDAPHSYGEVVAVLEEARRLGRHVRAMGSGWSFTDVMATNDFLIDTRRIRGIFAMSQGRNTWGHRLASHDPTRLPGVEEDPLPAAGYPADRTTILTESLRDDVLASSRRFVHVLAGTSIRELYSVLDAPQYDVAVRGAPQRSRWALPTMGGASGQTITGAISTGTHGGDFDLAPIAGMVRAIHFIAPDGSQHWVERAGAQAITEPTRLFREGFRSSVPAANLHYDDEMFETMLVSLGCLGIIYSLVLEVEEQFGLSEVVQETRWSAIRDDLRSGRIFGDGGDPRWLAAHPEPSAGPRKGQGLSIFINPYRSDDYDTNPATPADRRVLLVSSARGPHDGRFHDRGPGPGMWDLMHIIKDFESAGSPAATRMVVDRVLDILRPSRSTGGYPIAYSVLDTTSGDENNRVMSVEIVVSTAGGRHVDCIEAMLARFDALMQDAWGRGLALKFAGGINLRFTKPSPGYLAMQAPTGAAGERFCHMEIIVFKEVDIFGGVHSGQENLENYSEWFLDAFEQIAAGYGARMHWGQWSIRRAHDPRRFPNFARWSAVRARLTDNGRIRTFDNAFSVRVGLTPPPSGWSFVGTIMPPGSAAPAPTPTQAFQRLTPTAVRDPITGLLDVYAVGADGQLGRIRQQSMSRWGNWEQLPASTPDTIEEVGGSFTAVGRRTATAADPLAGFGGPTMVDRIATAYGREYCYVFARSSDGYAYQSNSPANTADWRNGWARFGGPRVVGTPAAVWGPPLDGGSGWPYLFVRSEDGQLRYVTLAQTFTRHGHFGDWYVMPALPGVSAAGSPTVVLQSDGRMRVCVRGSDGGCWTTMQNDPRNPAPSTWSAWTRIGTATVSGDIAIGINSDARLELFARGLADRLWHTWQTSPGGAFAPWQAHELAPFPLAGAVRPEVATKGNQLHVTVLGAEGDVHLVHQSPGAWVHRVLSSARSVTSTAALAFDPGGLVAIARAGHDVLVQRRL